MIRSIYTLLICFAFTAGLNAQSLQIEDIFEDLYDTGFQAVTVKANVRNISDQPLEIRVRRVIDNVAEESENFFCWAQCYGPNTNVSPSGLIAQPNEVISVFHGYYKNNGSMEIATIRYVFFVVDNPSDSISFLASFNPQTINVQDLTKKNKSVDVFPIPTTESVNFKLQGQLNEPHSLEIYSLDGRLINQIAFPSQSDLFNLSCTDYDNGVYLYLLKNNKEMIQTGRFVISK
jgi:hypothetical protein